MDNRGSNPAEVAAQTPYSRDQPFFFADQFDQDTLPSQGLAKWADDLQTGYRRALTTARDNKVVH
jgi:hypothetical protein